MLRHFSLRALGHLLILFLFVLRPLLPCAAPVESQHDVVIVGASLAGLTAASYLDGMDVVILERENKAGGKVNRGVYSFFNSQNRMDFPEIPAGVALDLVSRLGLTPSNLADPVHGYRDENTTHLGNEGLKAVLTSHSSPAAFDAFLAAVQNAYLDYVELPVFSRTSPLVALDSQTAREWFASQAVASGIQAYYEGVIRGLTGGASLDEISALALLRVLGRQLAAFDTSPLPAESGCFTLPGGIEDLSAALTEHAGRRLRLNSTVNTVTRDGSRFLTEYTDAEGLTHTLASPVVILAVPAKLNTYLAPALLTADQMATFASIAYTSFAEVELKTTIPTMADCAKQFMPSGHFFTHLINLYRFKSHPLLGEPYDTLTVIPPSSILDTTLNTLTDAELSESVIQAMEQDSPQLRNFLASAEVRRVGNALPVFRPGIYIDMASALNQGPSGLLFANDYLTHPTLEGALDAGYLAARQAKALVPSAAPHHTRLQ